MTLPHWATAFISHRDIEEIESAVQSAESKTSGELVPMIVRSSSTIGHVPVILALIFGFAYYEIGFWDIPESGNGPLAWLSWFFMIVTPFVLAILVARVPFFQRILTSKADQADQVQQRALLEFYQQGIRKTKDATGILVFVSLMEHRAVVLGDESIAKHLSEKDWQDVVDRLILGVKKKNLAQGFCDALQMSGDLLQKHFPIEAKDKNELKNHLIVKE